MGENQQIVLKKFKFEFRFSKVTLQLFLAEPNLVPKADILKWSNSTVKTVDFVFFWKKPFKSFWRKLSFSFENNKNHTFLGLVWLQGLCNVHNEVFQERSSRNSLVAIDAHVRQQYTDSRGAFSRKRNFIILLFAVLSNSLPSTKLYSVIKYLGFFLLAVPQPAARYIRSFFAHA